MSLSLILIFLFVLFLIPTILLSHNRLRFYIACSLPAFVMVSIFLFLNMAFPDLGVETKIGKTFLVLFSWTFKRYEELSVKEIYHLSFSFFLLCVYLLTYLVSFLLWKLFFIGINPNIHKPIRIVQKIFDGLFFFLMTYGFVFLFLISIRRMIPFPDGFLQGLFQWLYPLEV